MKKKIKRTGNTLCVYFTKEEQEIYKLKEGKIIEVEIKEVKK